MLFNSLHFLAFFVVVLAAYWQMPRRAQNYFLLAASYYFYGSWDWRFLSLIVASTATDYVVARMIERERAPSRRKRLLWVSVAVNLGILGVFKYFDFFSGSLAAALAGVGLHVEPWMLDIVLPVGISFYTFQTMSYTIDVYRGEIPACRDAVDFGLFVCFFPQLVAGPIEKAGALIPQLERERQFSAEQTYQGFFLIGWGLWKKILIADNLAPIVHELFQVDHASIWITLLAGYAFAFQIYCDFSGYSDVARGVAKTLGMELRLNFDLPYFATGIREFWRRWHISLSSWLRDYLYIPLGGNQHGSRRTYINLMITMLLGGLWHGAAWTFVLWGGLQGAMLCVDRWLGLTPARWAEGRVRFAARLVVVFHLVCLSWLVFRATGMDNLGVMLAGYAHLAAPTTAVLVMAAKVALLTAPLLLVQVLQYRTGNPLALLTIDWRVRCAAYVGFAYSLMLFGNFGGYDFIYFQF